MSRSLLAFSSPTVSSLVWLVADGHEQFSKAKCFVPQKDMVAEEGSCVLSVVAHTLKIATISNF